MQSLGPSKGYGRAKWSEEALLARGIAVPRERRLPVLSAARDVMARGPRPLHLGRTGRDRIRGKWLLLCILFLGSALIYGAIVGGQVNQLFNAAVTGVQRATVAMGFGVKRVTVDGRKNATDTAITAALAAGPNTLMLAFDTDAAKERLEAVPWIAHAQVMRLLPSTLQVVIEERDPYAVWQNKGKTYVVDEHGAVLAPALPQAYPDLPLVVGEGAGKHAAALYTILEPYQDLRRRMLAALRVGDRRWTLKLRTGTEIMLPDGNIEMALQSLTELEQARGILERDLAAIDLRLLDRITLRMREPASIPSAVPAPSDVPTAATGAAPNGRT